MPRRARLFAAFLLLLLPALAHATIVRAVRFDDKVASADTIFIGRCATQEAQWDASHRWILTYTTFDVEKTLKGFPAQRLTIVTPGGSVAGVHQETIGIPKFASGEEHVIFVRNTKAGPTVLYFDQGDYRVVEGEHGAKIAEPAVAEAVMVSDHGPVSPERSRLLDQFENEVRDSIRQREIERMEMIRRQKEDEASLRSVLYRNRALVILAIAGAALATWQLTKRA